MATCVNAGQALRRSLRVSASRNACSLPFLYQTPTLRRYYSELQNLAKENQAKTLSRKPKTPTKEAKTEVQKTPEHEDYVPFETPEGGESSVMPELQQGQTVTGTERRAFEQLQTLATSKTPKSAKKSKADVFLSLDEVLNEAISNVQRSSIPIPQRSKRAALTKQSPKLGMSAKKATSVKTALQENQEAQSLPKDKSEGADRVFKALSAAKTDMALWNILETELFNPITALHLDNPNSPTSKPTPKRRALMSMFPKRLVSAASMLRSDFPSSNLILSLLPKLRSMGPSAYALGATPKLYNQIMAFQFEKYTDVDGINALLAEMEKEVIEPNATTLQLLEYVLLYRQRVQQSSHVHALKSVWATEKFRRSFEVLARWKVRLEQRLQVQEIRAAKKARAKETEGEEGNDAASVPAAENV